MMQRLIVYQVAICLESFLYDIYRTRINHPEMRSADASYRKYQLQEMVDVASLLSSWLVQCYNIIIEKKLGNPDVLVEGEHKRCGTCPNCLGKQIFPSVSGMKTILFDFF